MPPKAAGRGAPASRRPGSSAARSGDQSTEPAENAANTATSSSTLSARPPVQRLQSLNRRTPGGSIGPRGVSRSLDDGPSKPVLKFAPRSAARRAKEERDAILELEAERNRQRLSEAAAIQRANLPRAPRARGAFRGRGGMPFSHGGGPVGFGGLRRGGGGGGGGGHPDFDSRASSVSRFSLSRSHTPAMRGYAAEYSSDEDEREAALRISIDQINSRADSDDDVSALKDVKGKKAVKLPFRPISSGPRPVRVERLEHEERVVSVNVEASSSISADLRRQAKEDDDSDNELFLSGDPETQADQAETKVKREPTDGDMPMKDVPHAQSEIDVDRDETPLPATPYKARKRVTLEDPRSLLRTKEEIDEYDRHIDDLEMLKDILTPSEPPPAVEKPVRIVEGEVVESEEATEPKEEAKGEADGDKEEEEPFDKNAGRLYLIQFPPLTPNLATPGDLEQMVTEIPDDTTEDVTIAQDSPRLGEPEVKREEDQEGDEKPKIKPLSRPSGNIVTATQRQLPAGRVGKLNLHKSGRVTLDWGGISFELDKGAGVTFVQEALIASTPSTTGVADDNGGERCVWAMGQLSEKFIASPEWNKLL